MPPLAWQKVRNCLVAPSRNALQLQGQFRISCQKCRKVLILECGRGVGLSLIIVIMVVIVIVIVVVVIMIIITIIIVIIIIGCRVLTEPC